MLATKMRYKTFLIVYGIGGSASGVELSPLHTVEVHNQAATGLRLSRDESPLISVLTSDGHIKTLTQDFQILVA